MLFSWLQQKEIFPPFHFFAYNIQEWIHKGVGGEGKKGFTIEKETIKLKST